MVAESPVFLDPQCILKGAEQVGLPEAALRELLDLARRIRDDEALCARVDAAHRAVYHTREAFAAAVAGADEALGDDRDLLHGLFVLDTLRLVTERQAARGIPPEISRAINARHGIAWLQKALDETGRVAITHWLPWWLRLVASGELYRLGRLEFVPERWEYPFRAYLNAKTDETVVVAAEGLSVESDAVVGTPISPRGVALQARIRLPLEEWRVVLDAGDWVLDLHVPAEGELSLDALRDAFQSAEEFFDQHYPDARFAAFVCDSWMFSTQLEAMLGGDSKILRWQREGYLLPAEGGHGTFVKFVFGSPSIDPDTAPRDTRLRRAILEHLKRGEQLHSGVYLLLRRDLGRFGTVPYRERSESAIRRLTA